MGFPKVEKIDEKSSQSFTPQNTNLNLNQNKQIKKINEFGITPDKQIDEENADKIMAMSKEEIQ